MQLNEESGPSDSGGDSKSARFREISVELL